MRVGGKGMKDSMMSLDLWNFLDDELAKIWDWHESCGIFFLKAWEEGRGCFGKRLPIFAIATIGANF
jgi:hypothetical protein